MWSRPSVAGAGIEAAVPGVRRQHRSGDQVGRAAEPDVPGLPREPAAVHRARQGRHGRRRRPRGLHARAARRPRRAAADAHLQPEHRPAVVGDARVRAVRARFARPTKEIRLPPRRRPRLRHRQTWSHPQGAQITLSSIGSSHSIPSCSSREKMGRHCIRFFSDSFVGGFAVVRHLQLAGPGLDCAGAELGDHRFGHQPDRDRVSRQHHPTGHGHVAALDDAVRQPSHRFVDLYVLLVGF